MKKLPWVGVFIGMLSAGCAQTSERRCMSHGHLVTCAAVPLESAARDAEAKQFMTPVDGKAHVYIMRSRVLEPRMTSVISVDGNIVGDLAPMTYLMLELAPGEHLIRAHTDREYETRVTVEDGKIYFIEHDLPRFYFFRPVDGELALVEPGAGKKTVMHGLRAQERR